MIPWVLKFKHLTSTSNFYQLFLGRLPTILIAFFFTSLLHHSGRGHLNMDCARTCLMLGLSSLSPFFRHFYVYYFTQFSIPLLAPNLDMAVDEVLSFRLTMTTIPHTLYLSSSIPAPLDTLRSVNSVR